MKQLAAFLILAITITTSSTTHAQQVLPTFSGIVIDSLSRKPLPNATITLKSGSQAFNITSNEKGIFKMNTIPSGVYRLLVTYSGYLAYAFDTFTLNSGTPFLNVVLSPEHQILKSVVVTNSLPFIVQKADKIVLNVAQSPIAAGDNAFEIVKRAPGIMDQNGLQFRGKNVTVYINDKHSRLKGEDLVTYLTSMPANSIERVEIIPNPSARYEAEGGSVINIVLAKNKNFGTNGTATIGMGSGKYSRYNAGVNLNYRNQKINIYGGYDYQHSKVFTTIKAQRFLTEYNMINETQTIISASDNNVFRFGFDYDISKASSFGILVRGNANLRKKIGDNTSSLHHFTTGNDSSSVVINQNRFSLVTPTINGYYKVGIGKQGGQLMINADYYNYSKRLEDNFTTNYFNEKGQTYLSPYLLRNNAPTNNRIQSFSADYTIGSHGVKYEMGLKTVLTKTDNESFWEKSENGIWKNDVTKSNHFIYRENINAAYLSAAKTFKKVEVQLGLRAEQTHSKGESKTLLQENENSYLSLFPSATLTYNQSDEQQYSISYRRKIERFGFDIVNPFIVYQNQFAYYQGNPDIKPTYSNNFDLSWSFRNEWLAAVSYSHFTDVLAEVYKKDSDQDILISTFDNVAGAEQIDMNLNYTKNLFNRKLTTTNTIGGLYAKYNAPANSQLNNAGMTIYVSSNNMVQLDKTWKAELAINYYSPLQFGAYHFKSQFGMNTGISKNILDNKGTLTFNVSDIFNSNKQRYTINSFGVRSVITNNAETRFAKLVFTYRFGNKNVKASRNRKTAIDDVKNRMKIN